MRFLGLLLLMTALLAGCAGSPPGGSAEKPGASQTVPAPPTRPPYLTGVITRVESGRILVEARPDKQEGNKCWFALTTATLLAAEGDGKPEQVDRSALQVGQRVKAWEKGAILESYPCQTGGEAILITPP